MKRETIERGLLYTGLTLISITGKRDNPMDIKPIKQYIVHAALALLSGTTILACSPSPSQRTAAPESEAPPAPKKRYFHGWADQSFFESESQATNINVSFWINKSNPVRFKIMRAANTFEDGGCPYSLCWDGSYAALDVGNDIKFFTANSDPQGNATHGLEFQVTQKGICFYADDLGSRLIRAARRERQDLTFYLKSVSDSGGYTIYYTGGKQH